MFSIDSKDFTIAAAARITIRDYSDYDSDLCRAGSQGRLLTSRQC